MDDLIAFLGARLDEDEAAAKAVQLRFPGPWEQAEATGSTLHNAVTLYDARDESVGIIRGSYAADYLVRHDPARALREVGVMRAIVDGCREAAARPYDLPPGVHDGRDDGERSRDEAVLEAMGAVGGALATIWEGHPDYRPEWKP